MTRNLHLNKKHPYWHQVQAEMVSVGVNWAHFVVWTKTDIKIIHVEEDKHGKTLIFQY